MDVYLEQINKNFIALSDYEIRRNNQILDSVVQLFVSKMKEKDPLFKAMFRRVFYGGGYYDGLKIDEPEEFDLDLLMVIPKLSKPVLTTSNEPGFVHLQVQDLPAWLKQPEALPAYRKFPDFLDEKNYLNTDNVLKWMEGLVQRVLNDLNGIFKTSFGTFRITFNKGGPAITLHLTGPEINFIDIDLVSCFVFGSDKWPANGFRANPVPSKSEFFIVPKKAKFTANKDIAPRYWRLSFQEQERVLMERKQRLKPTVKLLKRLKKTLGHDSIIASYYIKTVALHVVDKQDSQFWNLPLSHVFMTVLKEYKTCLDNRNIPYYWNKKYNLLRNIEDRTLDNINNRLRNVIKDLENKPETVLVYLGDSDARKKPSNSHTDILESNEKGASDSARCVIF